MLAKSNNLFQNAVAEEHCEYSVYELLTTHYNETLFIE